MPQLFALSLILIWACFILFGTYRRWPFFVNPPDWGILNWQLRFVRRRYGEKTLIIYTYVIAIDMIALSLAAILLLRHQC